MRPAFSEQAVERNRLLYQSLPFSVASGLLVGGVLAAVQAMAVGGAVSVRWFVALSLVHLIRLLIARAHRHALGDPTRAANLHRWFLAGALAAGAAWGSAGLVLSSGLLRHEAFLGFTLATVASAGVTTLAASPVALVGFLMLAQLPFALGLLLEPGPVTTAMGVLTLLLMGFLMVSGTRMGRILNDNVRHRLRESERKDDERRAHDESRRSLVALQRLYGITSDGERLLRAKIDAILDLGRDVFQLPTGQVARVEGTRHVSEHARGGDGRVEAGAANDLSVTYCSTVLAAGGPAGFHHVAESRMRRHACYTAWGIEAYIGAPILVDGELYGVLNFHGTEPRTAPFSETELALIQLMAEWIGVELARHRGAARLEESEERFRLILQSVSEGVYGLDVEGRTTFVNAAAASILGYTPPELLGRGMHETVHHSRADGSPYPPEDCPTTATLADGRTRTDPDEVLWRRDGTPLPVEYTTMPVLKDAEIVGAVVTFRDITERLHVERLKNEFVSMVSHELRTPLTSIRGSLGLVAGGATGALPDRAAELVRIAARNSERLILLINDLLDIDKIESGSMEFVLQSQPITPLVRQAVEANQAFAAERGVGLRMTGNEPEDDVRVNVDEHRLEQVLTNLLSNASKFSPEGADVDIRIESTADQVRISVRDRGPGIPAAFRDRIFDKFAQADSSDRRAKGGTGLGLNIARALVERMAGELSFESEEGKGATFMVTLPRSHALPLAAATGAEPVAPAGADPVDAAADDLAPSILVCESDAEVGEAIRRLLADEGYRCACVGTMEEARERVRSGARIDAFIIELALPDGAGFSLLRWLRTRPDTLGVPVVGVSATVEHGRLALNGEIPLVDWIQKPVHEEQLRSTVGALARVVRGSGRVLHVEDDADLRRTVAELIRDVARVDPAATVEAARTALAGRRYDVVLLDLGLPDGSGWDLLPVIQSLEPRPAVVIFSATAVGSEEGRRVEATLLKTGTSEQDLIRTLGRLLTPAGREARD